MVKTMKKIVHKGKTYYSQAEAARYLGTTTLKVREMMADSSLESEQLRVNGRILITAESLVNKKYARIEAAHAKSPLNKKQK